MRLSLNETMLDICDVLAHRAACVKRQVGCVLTSKDGQIVGTGYNGRARGWPNCSPADPCRGNICEGVHAEINALMQARGEVYKAYVSTFPCWHCIKSLLNTSCKIIVFRSGTMDKDQQRAYDLWLSVRTILVIGGELDEWKSRGLQKA